VNTKPKGFKLYGSAESAPHSAFICRKKQEHKIDGDTLLSRHHPNIHHLAQANVVFFAE
jgi:hypothetical protein